MVHVVGRSKNQTVAVSQDYIIETFVVHSVVYSYKQVYTLLDSAYLFDSCLVNGHERGSLP